MTAMSFYELLPAAVKWLRVAHVDLQPTSNSEVKARNKAYFDAALSCFGGALMGISLLTVSNIILGSSTGL